MNIAVSLILSTYKAQDNKISQNPIEKTVYKYIIVAFNLESKVILRLFWVCIAKLCDWLKYLAPLSQPIRSKTKTNRDLPQTFSHALRVCCNSSVVISYSDYFYFTTLK